MYTSDRFQSLTRLGMTLYASATSVERLCAKKEDQKIKKIGSEQSVYFGSQI